MVGIVPLPFSERLRCFGWTGLWLTVAQRQNSNSKALQEIRARAASDAVAVLDGLGEPALAPARVGRVEDKSGREER
jgi:hypothetical protein